MPTPAHLCAWFAMWGVVLPSMLMAQERTEREVVDLIVREGPRAQAIRAETEVARREQLSRLAYPNPAVAYSREGAGFTEFFQVEQLLPVFGTRAALSRAGVAATAAAEAERDARLWRLRTDATRLVARLIAEQERLEVEQATVREVERLIEMLRVREREGESSRFDRLRAEQELADVRHTTLDSAIAVSDLRGGLAALLPADTALMRVVGVLPAQGPAPTLDTLATRASTGRAELRALQSAAERADREAKAARRARLPAPTVVGGVKRADAATGRESGGVVGVSVSLPLFDTGGREAARWNAERLRVVAERASMERQIHAEIGRAAEAVRLRQQALSTAQPVAVGEELTRTAEVAFREGEVGVLALLDAVRTASRARTRDIEMRLDSRLAQIALEGAVGDVLWP